MSENKTKNIWIKFAYIFVPLGLAMHLLVLAIIAGYRLAWNYVDRERISAKVLVPFIIVAFSLTVLNLYLLAQPMGARYGM
jgi:hypothetical protein